MRITTINYNESELAFIKSNCTLPRRNLTALFNELFDRSVSINNIKSLCTRKGWKTGRDGRFKPGNIPHPNAKPKGPNKTSFKKGQKAHNWKPVGSERTNVEGYIEVKTAEPNVYELKHRVIWAQHYGPIDEQVIIRFIDNNRSNVSIDNLEAVTHAEHLFLNKNEYGKLPRQLKPTMKMVAKLETTAARLVNQERM